MRRNELLHQIYHMVLRRNDVGSILTLGKEDDQNWQQFLQRFDIIKKYARFSFYLTYQLISEVRTMGVSSI